jgi:uncharacterized protein (DUF1697 family)
MTGKMNKYIAFLRAINVAGHAKVKMNDLKQVFIEAGCKNVRTYIQSGNVLFEAPEGDMESHIQVIQDKLCELLGTETTVMYRALHEIEDIMRTAPFKDIETGTDTKLYVTFLSRKPRRQPALPLLSPKEALEAVKVKNLEIFIVSRKKKNGFFGFPNNFIEKEFDVPATTRNWTTVTKIAKLLSD